MKPTKLFIDFFNSEKSSGILLIVCTIVSIAITNSVFQADYLSIWNYHFADHTLTHWINDGLMAIFFLMIGLELEREVYIGELSNLRNSLLPVFAAIGGMAVPAGIHILFNNGTEFSAGAGIPMATDIAFALGVLSLLGKRVPASLKIFLTALAVIDDLGAIFVIAIFYTGSIVWINLMISLGIYAFLIVLNRLRIHNLIPYLIAGIPMWYFMLHSGIHATIAGVLLGFAIPFGDGSEKSPSYILQHILHKPVAFVILPIFALANTTIELSAHAIQVLATTNTLGIALGLIVGKPVGIISFAYLSVVLKLTKLPSDMTFGKMLGAGFLGGIGFTMSIFITLLAFNAPEVIEQSKIAVMAASIVAGTIGFIILKICFNRSPVSKPSFD